MDYLFWKDSFVTSRGLILCTRFCFASKCGIYSCILRSTVDGLALPCGVYWLVHFVCNQAVSGEEQICNENFTFQSELAGLYRVESFVNGSGFSELGYRPMDGFLHGTLDGFDVTLVVSLFGLHCLNVVHQRCIFLFSPMCLEIFVCSTGFDFRLDDVVWLMICLLRTLTLAFFFFTTLTLHQLLLLCYHAMLCCWWVIATTV